MKRVMYLILTLVMLVSILPMQNVFSASSGTCGDNLTWSLNNSGTLTISGVGFMYTSISPPWYSFKNQIKKIIINSGVTSIGSFAFRECNYLTNVIIPESVTGIGERAFRDCSSLTRTTIPGSVTSIGASAFYGCNLTDITIPDSVTSIGEDAFWGTPIYNNEDNWENGVLYIGKHLIEAKTTVTSHTIKSGTITIADKAFYNCGELTSVEIPDSVISIGNHVFYYCENLTNVAIGDGVTSIGAFAFYNCYSLTSITIPDSVTHIGVSAFADTPIYNNEDNWENGVLYIGKHLIGAEGNLTSHTIKEGAIAIAERAFWNCSSLTSITIPDSVTSVGYNAFYGCNPESIYITDIEAWMNITFDNNDDYLLIYGSDLYLNNKLLTNLVIPDGIANIDEFDFRGCTSLTSITIPDSVTSIGDYAFSNCPNLRSITIDDGVESIGEYAFYNCYGLTSITIPDSVTNIGIGAFYYCYNLKSVIIGDGVESIGASAFYNCESLKDITIGDGIKSVGEDAFVMVDCGPDYCDKRMNNIKNVYITDIETWVNISFGNIYSNPLGDGANLYLNNILVIDLVIPKGVTEIKERVLEGAHGIKSVTIPNGVISIGDSAFYNCYSLTSITIPNSVKSIGNWAFEYQMDVFPRGTQVNVFYGGTKEEFQNIEKGSDNSYLTNATIYYECNIDGMPLYLSPGLTYEEDYYKIMAETDVVLPGMEIFVAGYDEKGVMIAIKKAENNEAKFDRSLPVKRFKVFAFYGDCQPLAISKEVLVE